MVGLTKTELLALALSPGENVEAFKYLENAFKERLVFIP